MEHDDEGFYALTEDVWDLSTNDFLACQKTRDQTTNFVADDYDPSVSPVLSALVSSVPVIPRPAPIVTSHNVAVDSNEVVDQHLSVRSMLLPDYGHTWHPDGFGIQFSNGTLTIALNGLSLDKDWCDPNRVPHWALKNAHDLL